VTLEVIDSFHLFLEEILRYTKQRPGACLFKCVSYCNFPPPPRKRGKEDLRAPAELFIPNMEEDLLHFVPYRTYFSIEGANDLF